MSQEISRRMALTRQVQPHVDKAKSKKEALDSATFALPHVNISALKSLVAELWAEKQTRQRKISGRPTTSWHSQLA